MASLSWRECQLELLPGTAIRLTREQRVTEHQALERLGLALEGVDEVPVVDHAAAPADGRSRAARQCEHECARQVAIEPVAVEPHLQTMADQA